MKSALANRLALVAGATLVAVWLSVLVAIVYVIFHFAAKFW